MIIILILSWTIIFIMDMCEYWPLRDKTSSGFALSTLSFYCLHPLPSGTRNALCWVSHLFPISQLSASFFIATQDNGTMFVFSCCTSKIWSNHFYFEMTFLIQSVGSLWYTSMISQGYPEFKAIILKHPNPIVVPLFQFGIHGCISFNVI